jgi:hypothetical protein
VKFSVLTINPISTTKFIADSRSNWESAAVVVEYLFVGTMGNILPSDVELRDRINNQNHPYDRISWLNPKSKLSQSRRSGRYRKRDAVPTLG